MKKFKGIIMTLLVLAVFSTGCADAAPSASVNVETEEAASAKSEESTAAEVTTVPEQTAEEATTETEVKQEYAITDRIESPALAEELLGKNNKKPVYIYLPLSYYESEKKYPVVYYLHGYGEDGKVFGDYCKEQLDEAFEKGAEEFILVSVFGANSFYTNSPVTGNWEDYIADDLVSFIDEKFRTIKDKDSRGLLGFSMGGYGAYSIALNRPEVFNSFLAMSPGLIADDDFLTAFESWDDGFKVSYAQAFSPNAEVTKIYGNIPELSGTPEDDAVIEDWMNGFGNIDKRLDDYLALEEPLKAMKIVYGTKDGYTWIPKGCEFLSDSLEKRGIEHSIEDFDGRHNINTEAVNEYIVPFFNENLKYE